jgi:hypothetical protein
MKDWKQLATLPDRVRALEEEVARLRGKPQAPGALKTCPFCRAGTLRLQRIEKDPALGVLGVRQQVFTCDAPTCGQTVEEELPPGR